MPSSNPHPFDHLVVLMLENRSFDNLFGYLYEHDQPKHFIPDAACGILMGDNWLGKRIVTVDLLGDDFLDAVKTGDNVKVNEDGTIEIG